ncbi:MAG: winged helix-turn-helix domain-containing protein [Pseudomonadota bacterium]
MLQFNQFEFDSRQGQLWRNGKRVRLPRAARKLLLMLAADAGQVVSREALTDHIWGKTNEATDRRLSATVIRLRKGLGDTGIDPKLVVTVPRQGYRLNAKISGTAEPASSLPDAGTLLTPRLRIAAAALAVVVAAWAALTFIAQRPNTAAPAVPAVAEGDYRAAMAILASDGSGDLDRAEALLREALAVAPEYADAWAALASVWLRRPLPPAATIPQAREAALTALRHDAGNAAAKLRLAEIAVSWDRDWAQAQEYALDARRSAPDDASTHQAVAALHFLNGRPGEGEAAMLMALSTDPASPSVTSDLAWYYTATGRYDEAVEACDTLAALRQTAPRTTTCALQPLLLSGNADAAADLARGALERTTGRAPGAAMTPDVVLSLLWRNALLGLTETSRVRYVDPVLFARLHAQLGDRASALASLEQAVAERSPLAPRAHLFPEFQPLHSELAFLLLLREAGMPENPREVIERLR